MPSDSIIARWPSAVPPLCEPMAGKKKRPGRRAPRNQSPAGPRDLCDIRNPAAAGRDADVAFRHRQVEPIKLLADCAANVRDRIRDQLLSNAKELHSDNLP